MAIKYTYSFNCTIKYRFSDETDENHKFSDSTALYSCESELSPDNIGELDLPLPAYIQGVDTGIDWYLDDTYQNSIWIGTDSDEEIEVLKLQELKAANWSRDNEVKVGTFISCDATITLYSKSVQTTYTWNYTKQSTETTTEAASTTTQCWPTDNPLDTAPQIPIVVKAQEGDNITLSTFQNWEAAAASDTVYDAKYISATYSSAKPFMVASTDPFADAEPYHYGSGSPDGGYFIPIGEDNKTDTQDVKVQTPETNGYSNIKKIESFKIDSKELQYIEKGTFPLMRKIESYNSPYVADTHNTGGGNELTESNGETDIHQVFCELLISYDGDTVTKIMFNYYHTSTNANSTPEKTIESLGTADDSSTLYDKSTSTAAFTRHSDEPYPKRLGFILTGGGGGSGGCSCFDPEKDGKSDSQYATPGGGGGGAEIICGVFDLTKPTWVSDTLKYIIYLGNGGKGGKHWEGGVSRNNPGWGKAGEKGHDSRIWIYKNDSYIEICTACGGFGGGAGVIAGGGSGGSGGSHKGTYTIGYNSAYNFTLCKQIPGGKGSSQVGENGVENEALTAYLYFGTNMPPTDKSAFCLSLNHAMIKTSHTNTGKSKDVDVAGGHSFGAAGTKARDPVNGAGGACTESGGRDGAGGYFGLYY